MLFRSVYIVFLTCLCCQINPILAQSLSGFYGAFAPFTVSARIASLGGTQTALGLPMDGVYCNPASLVDSNCPEFSLHYFRHFGILPNLNVIFNSGDNRRGFSAGVMSNGDALYRENTISFGYAQRNLWLGIPFDIGGSSHFYVGSIGSNETPESIQGSVMGIGMHLGLRVWFSKYTALGCVVKNAVNSLKWSTSGKGNYSESLPRQLLIGVGYQDSSALQIGLDYEIGMYDEIGDRIHVGLEKALFPFLQLRTGYSWVESDVKDDQISIGIGLNHIFDRRHYMQFDIGYTIETLANTLRFSLLWRNLGDHE